MLLLALIYDTDYFWTMRGEKKGEGSMQEKNHFEQKMVRGGFEPPTHGFSVADILGVHIFDVHY